MNLSKISLILILSGTFSFTASSATLSDVDKTDMKLFFAAANPNSDTMTVPELPELTLLSGKVSMPTSCRGNVGLSITNAFTDGTLKKIYENFEAIVRQLASSEGAIFLGSLYISKSNPNLYQLLQQGIDLGVSDYMSAMGNCSSIAESLVEHVGGPVSDMQRKTKLNKIVELNSRTAMNDDWNNIKVEDLVKSGLDEAAEAGFSIFGHQKGGKDQPAIDVIDSTVKFGWCIYRGMTRDQCTDYYNRMNSGDDLPNLTTNQKLIAGTIDELNTAAITILGNRYISICKGCETIDLNRNGVEYWISTKQVLIGNDITNLASKSIQSITEEEYATVGFDTVIQVDANYFRNLAVLEQDAEVHHTYLSGWAYDVAYVRAVYLLDRIEDSLMAVKGDKDIQDASLDKEVETLLFILDRERDKLERSSKVNNYIPKMYIRRLLDVQRKRSANERFGSN